MGVRRQIYIDESDDRLLEEKSRSTGLSVSELIRQATHQCYGSERRLSWDEFFAHPVSVGSAEREFWRYDTLFDSEYEDLEHEDAEIADRPKQSE